MGYANQQDSKKKVYFTTHGEFEQAFKALLGECKICEQLTCLSPFEGFEFLCDYLTFAGTEIHFNHDVEK